MDQIQGQTTKIPFDALDSDDEIMDSESSATLMPEDKSGAANRNWPLSTADSAGGAMSAWSTKFGLKDNGELLSAKLIGTQNGDEVGAAGAASAVDEFLTSSKYNALPLPYPTSSTSRTSAAGNHFFPFGQFGTTPIYSSLPEWHGLQTGGSMGYLRSGFYCSDDLNGGTLSRESSKDDLTSLNDLAFDFEDRFRVDRRKLEMIIQRRFESITEPAMQFFERIGAETNTTVIWPTRIKVGAKSKKDPHIRIGGSNPSDVQTAKEIILKYLDIRTSRVTMKMDVSYTDHSHIIGKGGNTIRRVMLETGCHVHFPDSNRSNPNEKSNQVSIAGEMEGVEVSRCRVRELTPLIFCFDLPLIATNDPAAITKDAYVKTIQEQYSVQVSFRPKQKNFHTTIVVVKGCEWEASRVKEATLLLMDHFCCCQGAPSQFGSNPTTNHVFMIMEISPVHHSVVLGKMSSNLKMIMQRTKTTILFPDASDMNILPIRRGSVTITGMIHNVYMARQLLVGSLPVMIMFDLPDHFEVSDSQVQALEESLDLIISIKPKQRQLTKSVMIKAQERNASSIYRARHEILGLDGPPVVAQIPQSYKLSVPSLSSSPSGANQSANPAINFLNNNMPSCSYSSLLGMPQFAQSAHDVQIELSPFSAGLNTSDYSSASSPFPSQATSASSKMDCYSGMSSHALHSQKSAGVSALLESAQSNNVASFLSNSILPATVTPNSYLNNAGALPPNHPFLQEYARLVLENLTRLHSEPKQTLQLPLQNSSSAMPSVKPKPFVDNFGLDLQCVGASVGVAGDPGQLTTSPSLKSSNSPRNSSPVNDGRLDLSGQFIKLEMTESVGADPNTTGGTACKSGSTSSSSSSSSNSSSSSASTPPSSTPGVSATSATGSSSSTSPLGENVLFLEQLTDWRAPGCEKKLAGLSKLDYDQKKLLATKVIQSSKPTGEPRTPTSVWSGLGFSTSMPESAIRESLESCRNAAAAAAAAAASAKKHISSRFCNPLHVVNEDGPDGEKLDDVFSGLSGSEVAPEGKRPMSAAAAEHRNGSKKHWLSTTSPFESLLKPMNSLYREPEAASGISVLPTDDLPSLFARQGMAKYTDIFVRHEVDLATFATLTEQDLKEIGIQTFGVRKKLLLLANRVKQAGSHTW